MAHPNRIRSCMQAIKENQPLNAYNIYELTMARGELAREKMRADHTALMRAQLANKPSMRHPLVSVEPPAPLTPPAAPTESSK